MSLELLDVTVRLGRGESRVTALSELTVSFAPAALTAVVATATIAVVGVAVLAVQVAGDTEGSITSARSRLAADSAVVFANHPVVGVGAAGQPVASRAEAGARYAHPVPRHKGFTPSGFERHPTRGNG